jgi:hypothetical protein
MDEPFIDDLARTIATPMSRSRALRLIGTIVLGGLLPRRLRAYAVVCGVYPSTCPSDTDPTRTQLCCIPNGPGGSLSTCCKPTEICCTTKSNRTCCQPGQSCGEGINETAICLSCSSGQTPCGSICCAAGETCIAGTNGTSICCASGKSCGSTCCQPDETCGVGVDGKPKCGTCPPGQTLCGTKCCSGSCINPASGCCGSGIACGKTCCDPGTTCINTAQGLSCCPVGQSRLVLKSTILWSRAIYLCCNKGDMVLDGVECCPVNRIVAATPIADLPSRGSSILSEGTRQRTHFCCPAGSISHGSCCSVGGKPCGCHRCPPGSFCVGQVCKTPAKV